MKIKHTILFAPILALMFASCAKVPFFVGNRPLIAIAEERIAAEDYAAYGIAEDAERAYVLTATVTPEDAGTATWTLAFANPSGAWAKGKSVSDYVVLEDLGDNTATVACRQAFGEPVVVTASADGASDSCTLQYERRLKGFDLTVTARTNSCGRAEDITVKGVTTGTFAGSIQWYETWNFYAVPVMEDVYTVDKTVKVTSVNLRLTSAGIKRLNENGFTATGSKALSVGQGKDVALGDAQLKTLFGTAAVTNKNMLASAFRAMNRMSEDKDVLSLTFTTDGGTGYGLTVYFTVDYRSLE